MSTITWAQTTVGGGGGDDDDDDDDDGIIIIIIFSFLRFLAFWDFDQLFESFSFFDILALTVGMEPYGPGPYSRSI